MADTMNEIIERILELKGWKNLNQVQRIAVKDGVLDQKNNFVIIAPTASGKTGIAEMAILQELQKKGKAIYTVPSHALINDKLKDFRYLAEDFEVKEGDSSFSRWARSDLIITTFELLYRACLMNKDFLDDFGLVIVDEFHILYDKMRGYNLEKLLTALKEGDTRIICISATFENKKEIGEWLEAKVVHVSRTQTCPDNS
jgi:helicase